MPPEESSPALKPTNGAQVLPSGTTSGDAAATSATKRRRMSGTPSSRGVANLTPEQLARKRANDREAQRAIRERTRNTIESLQARIRELENQQPYHELQIALRAKEAVERENEDIRRRLASIWSIVQPIIAVRGRGLEELAAAASRSPLLPHPSDSSDTNHLQIPPADLPPSSAASNDSASRHWFNSLAPTSNPRSDAPDTTATGWPSSNGELGHNIQPDLQNYGADERLGVNFLLDDPRQGLKLQRAISDQSASPTISQGTPLHVRHVSDNTAPYAALPRHLGPTCPLDNILLDAIAERRGKLEAGRPAEEVVGPEYPNFSVLMDPQTQIPSHPLSQLLTDILRTFPDISRLPEQVAVTYIMFLVLRWQVHPTPENFSLLPEWQRPRVSQIINDHPHWVDHLPWPRLRDLIIEQSEFVAFEAFFVPYTTTCTVNWPYDPRDCLIEVEVGGGMGAGAGKKWIMNPVFETHLRDLGNWSLGSSFVDSFPHLAEGVRIL